MKGFGFLFMLLLIGTTTLLYFGYSSKGTAIFNPAMVSISGSMNAMTLTMLRRKLKENMNPSCKDKYYTNDIDLQDYHPIDPVPSSRDYIHTGPIEHGTPLMPYVPGPSPPPEQENHGNVSLSIVAQCVCAFCISSLG